MTTENKNTDGTSWMILLESIKNALKAKEIDKTEVSKILSAYKSKEEHWIKYAYFDEKQYTSNLVGTGNKVYNLMLLAWNPSQGSSIHNHPDSTCFVKVLTGSLREIRYETPKEGKELTVISDCLVERDEVVYIDDSIGVHEFKNDTANQVISLHLSVPPYHMFHEYDRETATVTPHTLRFFSVYGEKCDDPKSSEKIIEADTN